MKSIHSFGFFLLVMLVLPNPRCAFGDDPKPSSTLLTKSLIPFKSSTIENLAKEIDPEATVESPLDDLDFSVQIRGKQISLELNRMTLDVVVGEVEGVDSDAKIDALAKLLNGKFTSVDYENRRMIFFESGRNPLMVYALKTPSKKRVSGLLPIPMVWDLYKIDKSDKPEWLKTAIQPAEALKIGRFLLSNGKSKLKFPLLKTEEKSVYYIVNEDDWLHKKYEFLIQFEMGRLRLDAQTGQVDSFELDPNYSKKEYEAKHSSENYIIYEKPLNYIPFETEAELQKREKNYPRLVFNGEDIYLEGRNKSLHFPPIISGASCLINSQYFSSFLINAEREGEKLTLQGQLPAKGKKAELKLGSASAIVDGKTVTLSTAPQEIDGRLYLPYELLTLCNGVLTRWEPKKNTLWVDTRFLRRP